MKISLAVRHAFANMLGKTGKMADSLDDLLDIAIECMRECTRQFQGVKVVYVSGMISSDGPPKIPENLRLLAKRTEEIRVKEDEALVFSASDIFSVELGNRLHATGVLGADYMLFWRKILEAGIVDTVVMTKRWRNSVGARDEFNVAMELGLKIIDEDPQEDLREA